MVDDTVKYEFKGAATLRGMEAPTIAKWQTEGWELVAQKPGRVRIQLMFRRPKPKSAGAHLLAAWTALRRLHPAAQTGLAMTAALVVAAAVIGIAMSGGGSSAGGGGGSVAAAEPAATLATATPTPAIRATGAAASSADKILTRKNNKDLAKLLAVGDPGEELVADFAKKYEGRTIAFNGNVAVVSNFDDETSKSCDRAVVAGCDFMLHSGDFDPDSATGPNFKFDGVDSVQDLRIVGYDASTRVSTGDDVRVIAVIKRYESVSQFLYLAPVLTRLR